MIKIGHASSYWWRSTCIVVCRSASSIRRNPDIEKYAKLIGRTPSALAMKLTNIASLDPAITSTGRSGLKGASQADKAMWHEMQCNWEDFAIESYKAIEAVSAEFNSDVELEAQEAQETQGSYKVPDYTGGSRTAQAQARIGQDFFERLFLAPIATNAALPD